ncbi:hypothetical protein C8R45DRAFT_945166 [Mycena sanguinolenta]|nr:hypothetical protein C8R45DRAFT_945166 [Mycena sanguinolenta]
METETDPPLGREIGSGLALDRRNSHQDQFVLYSISLAAFDSARYRYTNSFFPNAQHFVVAGGNFSITNIHQTSPTESPVGSDSGPAMVHRQRRRSTVRRMYLARLHGSSMTAAFYEGNGAEEASIQTLRSNIYFMALYSNGVARLYNIRSFGKDIWSFVLIDVKLGRRHPNLLQLYGTVASPGLYAAVFHDGWNIALAKIISLTIGSELIPANEVLKRYNGSHFATVYFWQVLDVWIYMSFSGRILGSPAVLNHDWYMCTLWIRSSTGKLCIDLTPPEFDPIPLVKVTEGFKISGTSLFNLYEERQMITSMPLHRYYDICYFHLYQWHCFTISTNVPVALGTIRRFSGQQYEHSVEIASMSECNFRDVGWSTRSPIIQDYWNPINANQESCLVMDNGWIRVTSAEVANEYRRQIFPDYVKFPSRYWLAQSHHIFHSCGITSNFEDYGNSEYCLEFSGKGFHKRELQSGSHKCFHLPDCAAYWAFDPSGAERLGPDEAKDHGFPDIQFRMDILGRFWSKNVYAGVQNFHKSKGLDPKSQEVAQELGVPLFQVACVWDSLFPDGRTEDGLSDSASAGVHNQRDLRKLEDRQYERFKGRLYEDGPTAIESSNQQREEYYYLSTEKTGHFHDFPSRDP